MAEYPENFEKAVDFVLRMEGGYVNDPNDKGGETKYGISKKQYPNLIIKKLTRKDAENIYWADYWLECKAHTMQEPLGMVVFNFAVNMGAKRATVILQQSLNMTRSGKLKVDGIHGIKTGKALLEVRDISSLIYKYLFSAMRYYMVLRDKNKKFFDGWIIRTIRLENEIKALL